MSSSHAIPPVTHAFTGLKPSYNLMSVQCHSNMIQRIGNRPTFNSAPNCGAMSNSAMQD